MELKFELHVVFYPFRYGLNRTFYGIEIPLWRWAFLYHSVLIVPFMELKCGTRAKATSSSLCLNRTFYGIEI